MRLTECHIVIGLLSLASSIACSKLFKEATIRGELQRSQAGNEIFHVLCGKMSPGAVQFGRQMSARSSDADCASRRERVKS